MSSSVDAYLSDLIRATQSGHKLQDLINRLRGYFRVESIPEKGHAETQCWSAVECAYDASEVLKKTREEFINEFVPGKEMANFVLAILSRSSPPKSLHIARKAPLLAFQDGWSNLQYLVGKDDCIVLIPVAIAGSTEVTVKETKGDRRTTVTLATNSQLIVPGTCSIWIPPLTKIVCIVFCITKDKE